MAVEDKESGEPVQASWTSSEYDVTGVVVKAGSGTCTYDYDNATSVTVETCSGTAGGSSAEDASLGGVSGQIPFGIAVLATLSVAGAVAARVGDR